MTEPSGSPVAICSFAAKPLRRRVGVAHSKTADRGSVCQREGDARRADHVKRTTILARLPRSSRIDLPRTNLGHRVGLGDLLRDEPFIGSPRPEHGEFCEDQAGSAVSSQSSYRRRAGWEREWEERRGWNKRSRPDNLVFGPTPLPWWTGTTFSGRLVLVRAAWRPSTLEEEASGGGRARLPARPVAVSWIDTRPRQPSP